MANSKNTIKGSSNRYALINNKPQKRFRKFLCPFCDSKDIRPVLLCSETGRRQGIHFTCNSCEETFKKRKILEL